jgi:hypothetical protein
MLPRFGSITHGPAADVGAPRARPKLTKTGAAKRRDYSSDMNGYV